MLIKRQGVVRRKGEKEEGETETRRGGEGIRGSDFNKNDPISIGFGSCVGKAVVYFS